MQNFHAVCKKKKNDPISIQAFSLLWVARSTFIFGMGLNDSFTFRHPLFRSRRALQAVLRCLKKAIRSQHLMSSRPKVVLVSDTPAVVKGIKTVSNISEFAEVIILVLIAKLHADTRINVQMEQYLIQTNIINLLLVNSDIIALH